jgi:acetyltransferase-like isoleucine patch superfamily enzyme
MLHFVKKILKLLYFRLKYPKVHIGRGVDISLDSSFGKYVKIYEDSSLNSCQVESFTYIGNNCHLSRTTIGSFVSIGPDLIAGLGSHPTNYFSTYPGFYSNDVSGSFWFGLNHEYKSIENKRVIIESDVWIGARVIILGGVKIGVGAIVAAGSVVTKDVLPYCVVGGVPAKQMKFRFTEDIISKLIQTNWWQSSEEELMEYAKYSDNITEFLRYCNKSS